MLRHETLERFGERGGDCGDAVDDGEDEEVASGVGGEDEGEEEEVFGVDGEGVGLECLLDLDYGCWAFVGW